MEHTCSQIVEKRFSMNTQEFWDIDHGIEHMKFTAKLLIKFGISINNNILYFNLMFTKLRFAYLLPVPLSTFER